MVRGIRGEVRALTHLEVIWEKYDVRGSSDGTCR